MHGSISEWFEKIISYQFFIDSIEKGEPSQWLLDLMKAIHKSKLGKEKIEDENILDIFKELRSKTAEKLSKELGNPT